MLPSPVRTSLVKLCREVKGHLVEHHRPTVGHCGRASTLFIRPWKTDHRSGRRAWERNIGYAVLASLDALSPL